MMGAEVMKHKQAADPDRHNAHLAKGEDGKARWPDNEDQETRLKRLREETEHPSKKKEIGDLPSWVRTALVYHEIQGMPYKECAARFDRAEATLANYAVSPAGKKWREALLEVSEDPERMAKGILKAAVAECAADIIWAIDAAKRVGDYQEVRIATQGLLDRLDVTTPRSQEED